MKLRASTALAERIPLDMTPMIDIVFQLMAFFIMTLKIVLHEGDFDIRMPAAGQSAQPILAPLHVTLRADEQGNLAAASLGERNLGTDLRALRTAVADIVGTGDQSLIRSQVSRVCTSPLGPFVGGGFNVRRGPENSRYRWKSVPTTPEFSVASMWCTT